MRLCRRYLVSGRVQGVFYRATVQETAQRLGLTGWVRNLHDGRVEVVACGEEEKLEALETWLWEGPAHAQVNDVVSTTVEVQEFSGFTMRY